MSTSPTYNVWIPPHLQGTPLAQVWLDAWVSSEDAALADAAVRRDERYDDFFPGNRREDGTVLYTEGQYLSIVERYDQTLMSFGLNPELFRGNYGTLISGLVSAPEFADRLDEVYEGIIDQAPSVAEYYANNFGIELTTEAIFASALDPNIDQAIIAGDIAVSQVGGMASQRGFQIATDFARQLVHAGTDTTSEAAQFFSLAEGALPVLQALSARHQDPDDDFTLEEFTAATIFGDPEQRRRLRRLMAQETTLFESSPSLTVATTQTGGLAGLESR